MAALPIKRVAKRSLDGRHAEIVLNGVVFSGVCPAVRVVGGYAEAIVAIFCSIMGWFLLRFVWIYAFLSL